MSSGKPSVLVLRAAGTNCDRETVHAFELAGANVETMHVRHLLEAPDVLDRFQLLAIPGGFSYGDDIAAGRILAAQMRRQLAVPLRAFVDRGKPVIGICNGFQVLLQTDLLPGPSFEDAATAITLTDNEFPRFTDRWVTLEKVSDRCVWTASLAEPLEVPIAHGEGRLAVRDAPTLAKLQTEGHVAVTYLNGSPNGSAGDIAGLTDASGRVFGLMPHPERYVVASQHAAWTRRGQRADAEAPGLAIFKAGVAATT